MDLKIQSTLLFIILTFLLLDGNFRAIAENPWRPLGKDEPAATLFARFAVKEVGRVSRKKLSLDKVLEAWTQVGDGRLNIKLMVKVKRGKNTHEYMIKMYHNKDNVQNVTSFEIVK